jgi:hypothetical protein
MKKSYYISQAGGYAFRAKKAKAYVVYMNGTVARLKGATAKKIEPGCEIIVPVKPERSARRSVSEILSMSTTATSMAAVVASLVNLFK